MDSPPALVMQTQDDQVTESEEYIGQQKWYRTTSGTKYQFQAAGGNTKFQLRAAADDNKPVPRSSSKGLKRKRVWHIRSGNPRPAELKREDMLHKRWEAVLPIGQTLRCVGILCADRPMYFRLYLGRKQLCDISVLHIGGVNAWSIAMRICQAVLDKEILPTRGNFATLKEKYLDEKARELGGWAPMPMSASSSST